MTDGMAQEILHEVKSIRYYQQCIKELNDDLKELSNRIHEVGEPKSSLSGLGNVPITNHVETSTIVNALLADEQYLVGARDIKYKQLAKAERYRVQILSNCSEFEIKFADALMKGTSYDSLSITYGYTNPYKAMISIIKRIDKKHKIII